MIARRTFTATGMVALAAAGVLVCSPRRLVAAPPAGFTMHSAPRALPDIVFQSGRGQTLGLEDFRGRWLLLNLWATWCAPCRAEMPTLDNLQAKLGGSRFEVVALSLDHGGVDEVESFYRELGLQHLAIYVDPTTTTQRRLKVFGLPTTLLVDHQGLELGRLIGPAEWDSSEMVAFLRSMIERGVDERDDLIEDARPFIRRHREMVG